MKPAVLILVLLLLPLDPASGADPGPPAGSARPRGLAEPRGSEADFRAGMEEIRRMMASGRWSAAAQHLNGLLEEHRGRDYAYARRSEIEECIKDCAFWRTYSPPDPKRLVSGRLVHYRESTGDITLSYTASEMGDFMETRSPDSRADKGRTLIHPAVFNGPYTVAVKGSAYPTLSSGLQPRILVDLTEDAGYSVIFGFKPETRGREQTWLPAQIGRWQGKEYRELVKTDSPPCDTGKPFAFEVNVSEKEIAAHCDGRLVMKADKERGRWGRLGIREIAFDEITIEGRIQTSWIQGLLDAAMQSARAEFESRFDASSLPDWLQEGRRTGTVPVTKQQKKDYPGPERPGQEAYLSKAFDLYNKGLFREGLNYTMTIPDGKVTEEAREFLLASFFMALEDHERAFDCCTHVCRLDPDFYETRFMRAFLLAALGHKEKAIEEYRALMLDSPRDGRIYPGLAGLLLKAGRPDEAKSVIDLAIRQKLEGEELNKINRLLVKALHGPVWERVFEYRSQHYHVLSDIDQETCLEAAQILEDAYSAYTTYLQWIKDLEKKKFRVYLFSGEAGYRAYLDGIDTDVTFDSAGLYIPSLKQLLIWNLPDREMMMRVVRHEGFHQYLDRLMDSAPIWFNEGLAEYYERSVREQGRWTFGQVHSNHVRVLKDPKTRLMPIKFFIHMERGEFNADPRLSYAQSWAFVHFLRHGTKANSMLFERLFQALQRDAPAAEALNEVFGRVDLQRLQAEFEAYIEGLE